ncbi:hypothetical protein BABINDRAFT_5532 [Babjeviella inositovora NRRL Y-12698]|uniref:Phospholipid/glycerol acyltransferase domain-containing protein n=1 Tax=Babjeviella inositovora NRRL Y-12698 TaxID=984486 RepID=A0A1E3QY48_9ASCO|nr:uncharacterized protein BABINDRAFT_5532 [Babjeviella inositovora NRRL Y-12698]ODQ82590.1 hypothetical protein BABINDRAFT_5532 [Babjeviella inositovora NRRL Y-12698]
MAEPKSQGVSTFRKFVYDIVLWIFDRIFDCFFREIRTRGAFRVPRTGAVIFVAAPHANQFVDPGILMGQVQKEASRRISFLVADKSYRRWDIGLFSRCQLAILVKRAQDNLRKATGKIKLDFDADPLLVRGVGTKFTKECTVKGLIALPESLGTTEILEILSDTELLVRKEFKRNDKTVGYLAKGTNFKVADKVNQKEVYEKVFSHLSQEQCIGIFPEGGSHDRTDLLPLKAGVAIMALGAMDHDPKCNVKIVPCGMNYFHPHKFRSRAVVEFGRPIEINRELVQRYANPESNREAVRELLDTITAGLKAVTVTCTDYETLMVVQGARRLYAGNFGNKIPLPLVVEFNRRLVIGYDHFKENPKIQHLKDGILHYNQQLKFLHLSDHQVEEITDNHLMQLRMLPVFLARLFQVIVLFILALPGAILFAPVFIVTKRVSKKKAAEALAASTVKVRANDVLATWKILIAMGLSPLLYIFYASIGTYYCYYREIFASWRLSLVFCTLYISGASITYAALIVGDQGMDILKSLRPLYFSLTTTSSVSELKQTRQELSEQITEVVNELGPELFPDFNLLEQKRKVKRGVDMGLDSDAEEEAKTQELRQRRAKKRAEAKRQVVPSDGGDSFSDSDGVSRINSSNDLSDIPMFSNYNKSSMMNFRAYASSNTSESESEMEASNGFKGQTLLSSRIREKMFEDRKLTDLKIGADTEDEDEEKEA